MPAWTRPEPTKHGSLTLHAEPPFEVDHPARLLAEAVSQSLHVRSEVDLHSARTPLPGPQLVHDWHAAPPDQNWLPRREQGLHTRWAQAPPGLASSCPLGHGLVLMASHIWLPGAEKW